MSERIIIVAQAENGVIGRNNAMPWHLPRDLRYFKQQTQGHPVIMGRKTYQSLGKALPNRVNIVISRQALDLPDAHLAASLTQAIDIAKNHSDKLFIIGGAQIYAEALAQGLVDTLLVTHVHAAPQGDTFFPAIDGDAWQCVSAEEAAADADNAYAMTFSRYERKK